MRNLTQDEIYEMLARVDSILKTNKIKKMDFYKYIGITSGAFSQWKSGATSPKPENIKRIASYLGVTESYLIDGADNEKAATPEGDGLDEDTLKLARRYQSMNAEGRKAMRALAKVLTQETQDDDNE